MIRDPSGVEPFRTLEKNFCCSAGRAIIRVVAMW
jgi:hypothetical protein